MSDDIALVLKDAEDQPRLDAAILRVPRLQMLRDVIAQVMIGACSRGLIARRRRAARQPS